MKPAFGDLVSPARSAFPSACRTDSHPPRPVPGQEVLYNFDAQPKQYNPALFPCQNWRSPITASVVHSRQSSFNDPTGSPGGFVSPHVGGAQFLLMDGSARMLNEGIDIHIMWALCTRNNRETISVGF